jgi:trans-2,3-dihydro-3-hydroxyanthranilate isomerase
MTSDFVLCDVFADAPLCGNQLAVFLAGETMDDHTMASLAREFGWSEVTFVLPPTEGGHLRVRIWTPEGELPFAGHPTVGTAVVLAAEEKIDAGWNILELGIGAVAVEVTEVDRFGGSASMTQRAPEFGAAFEDRRRLAQALGLEESDLVPELPARMVSTGLAHFLVPVRSLDALGRVRPDPVRLPPVLGELGARWAYLFTTETPQSTSAARARLLRPGTEDAATGSAAGPLGAYLVYYGLHRPGDMDIEQGIEMGRPSRIRVTVPQEAGEIGPVQVAGNVRIWGRGALEVPASASSMLEP